jgi:L-gulonate 5-dehydrogenase
MKALVFTAPEAAVLTDWPEPEAGPEEVVIRPLTAGICAGDLQHYAGRNPYTRYPLIGGHEVCGVVERTGPKVTRVRPGDTVVIEPVVGCGRCYPCSIGRPNCCMNFCLIGLHRPGGFAERTLVPERNLHRVPEGLDPVTASFAEPLTIGLHACRRANVQPRELVVVLGAGPIGLAIVEAARVRGTSIPDASPSRGSWEPRRCRPTMPCFRPCWP